MRVLAVVGMLLIVAVGVAVTVVQAAGAVVAAIEEAAAELP